MSRKSTFEREEVGGIRGLTSLTEPADDDPIGAVVDVAVIGARGDGKTQFIVHAIRTLRAYAPVLDGAEHQYNRDVLQVVMNARVPRPEATAPGVVPHYVFRIRAESLLGQIGALSRLALYARVAGLWTYILLSLSNALLLWLALDWLAVASRPALLAGALGVFIGGAIAGTLLSRQRFLRRGDIELVFWDVAGEHVYSHSAADYYSFLSALVRMRRRRASAHRAYAFAPVLICNPVALGTRTQGSSYARLRKLIPLFASLNEPLAHALVAINRWTVVKQVCAPDTDRRELLAIVSKARLSEEDLDEQEAAELLRSAAGDNADETVALARTALPVVKRDVLRKHCLDAENGTDNDVHFTYLRYDAGMHCEFHERPWQNFDDLDDDARRRWRAPTASSPKLVLDYEYEDGPGAFEGDVRRVFLAWIAGLAFHQSSYGQTEVRRVAEPADELADDTDMDAAGDASLVTEAAFVKARRESVRSEKSGKSGASVGESRSSKSGSQRAAQDDSRNAWKPRPLSATGLEDFARGTIVPNDWLASAIDASLRTEPADKTPEKSQPSGPRASSESDSSTSDSLSATIVEPAAVKTTTVKPTIVEPASAKPARSSDDALDRGDTLLAAGAPDTQMQTARTPAKSADAPARPASRDDAGHERPGTNPGFGSLDDLAADGIARPNKRARTPSSEPARDPSSDTLRMPGGFGSGGT